MSPLLYDVKRTFTSKSVLISMAALILLSFALVPSFTTTSGGLQANSPNTQVFTYYDSSGDYHFLAFAWNQFGQPLSGVAFQANLSAVLASTLSGPVFTSPSGYSGVPTITNASGIAQFTINAPLNENYTVYLSIKQPNGQSSYFPGYSQPYLQLNKTFTGGPKIITEPIPPGQTVSLLGSPFSSVTDSTNASKQDILANWVGFNGSVPVDYPVFYKFFNVSEVCTTSGNTQSCYSSGPALNITALNENNMQRLGTMNSYLQVLNAPKLEANLSSFAQVAFGLFYPNGTFTSAFSLISVSQLYPQQNQITGAQGGSFVISFFEGVFGLFIPLIAIIGSYNSYGKDRLSGVLESVLSQPVSRRGLAISRFLSNFVAMAAAISIAIVVVDSIVWYFTKSLVDGAIILSSTAAFFVELASFIGIMMLLSHLVRSSGALIGIGIGLFLVIDFFWELIMALIITLSKTGFGSSGYLQILIAGAFANPAQYVSLVVTYLTHAMSFAGMGGGAFGFTLTPSAYGITIPSIVVAGLLWVALPLAGFLYLATRRD